MNDNIKGENYVKSSYRQSARLDQCHKRGTANERAIEAHASRHGEASVSVPKQATEADRDRRPGCYKAKAQSLPARTPV
jgi:hypothetical protein